MKKTILPVTILPMDDNNNIGECNFTCWWENGTVFCGFKCDDDII